MSFGPQATAPELFGERVEIWQTIDRRKLDGPQGGIYLTAQASIPV
jgi:hypothetical protein